MSFTTPAGVTYHTGHRRAPNKDHLMALSYARHALRLRAIALQDVPNTWDSRTQGWIPPVKDQSSCGSCWDFSGTGVVEIALIKNGLLTVDQPLSEQYTISCGHNGGCNGDDNVTVLAEAKQDGLPLTSDYGPYTSGSGGGGTCKWTASMKRFKIDDWGFADSSGGQGVTPTPDIKLAIMTYGCVGCAVAAGGDNFWNTGQGVGTGTSHSIDHDVILVGWDDSKGSKGAWIMRNSWGPSWGSEGYAWIAYGAYDIGTEAVFAKVANPNPPPLDWSQL